MTASVGVSRQGIFGIHIKCGSFHWALWRGYGLEEELVWGGGKVGSEGVVDG